MEDIESPHIVIIGDVNVDIITPPFDPALLEGDTSVVLDGFTTSLGGNAVNVAATLAALGTPHYFLGAIGDCGNSIWIRKKLEELGVQSHLHEISGEGAGITFAMTYNNGERQFVATLGTNSLFQPQHLDQKVLDNISEGSHLYRAGFWYTPGIKGQPTINMYKDTLKKGGETSLDVGWDPEGFTKENREILYDTLNYTKYFFVNEKEIKNITQKDDIDQAYEELLGISTEIDDPIFIIHRGEKGSAIISRKERIFIDQHTLSQPIKVLNPTGTGDIFNAAFLHGILNKWSLEKSIKFANAAALVHIQDITKIYPKLQDIEQIYK